MRIGVFWYGLLLAFLVLVQETRFSYGFRLRFVLHAGANPVPCRFTFRGLETFNQLFLAAQSTYQRRGHWACFMCWRA